MSVRAPRTVDLVVQLLRRQILQGRYGPGERLPPERQLAEDLDINRLTLRSALARLEAEGLTQARQGRGVTVNNWRTSANVGLLRHLIVDGSDELLPAFLTLRRAVAVEAVAAACQKASEQELEALSEIADKLSTEADTTALARGDLGLTRRVLRLADNLPMELLFNTIADVFERRPELMAVMYAHPEEVRASFPLVVALLRGRDPDAARTLVRQALEALDARTIAELQRRRQEHP